MNYLIGLIATNITLGVISGLSNSINGCYQLSKNIIDGTNNGSDEIKQLIKDNDIEIQLNSIKQIIKEMKLNESLSSALICCLNTIDDAIIDIEQELDTIDLRIVDL